MSVASYLADDLFVVRTVKSLFTNPGDRWANTYEVKAVLPGSTDELLALAAKLVLFERLIHAPATQFVGMSVSTWEADSVPYNPDAFLSSALSAFGTRSVAGNPTPLSMCLSVARVPPLGRLGHLFYRGSITENDVDAPAGRSILSNPGNIQTEVDAAIVEAELTEHLGAGAAVLQIVMVSKNGGNIRPVLGLVPVGVSQVPTDHAWFNRTTP